MNRLQPERVAALLDRARQIRVLVVGDIMLDVYLRGGAFRISPEAPVPVVRIAEESRALGGAANVATNVVALGARCALVGCIGRDSAGDEVRRELARLHVDDAGLVSAESRPTTVKTRIVARNQQVVRFDLEVEDDVDLECAGRLVASIERQAPQADVVILEDYNKGVLGPAVIEAALAAGRRLDVPVIVDPKARNFFGFRGATIFKPNLAELAAALRDTVRADDPVWMEETRRHLDCEHLLLTLGEDGMALRTGDGHHVRVPTLARSVYDVSGAGDTVTAVIAVALAAGASPVEAAVLANHAAGIEVGKAGVAAVSAAELLDAVRLHYAV